MLDARATIENGHSECLPSKTVSSETLITTVIAKYGCVVGENSGIGKSPRIRK